MSERSSWRADGGEERERPCEQSVFLTPSRAAGQTLTPGRTPFGRVRAPNPYLPKPVRADGLVAVPTTSRSTPAHELFPQPPALHLHVPEQGPARDHDPRRTNGNRSAPVVLDLHDMRLDPQVDVHARRDEQNHVPEVRLRVDPDLRLGNRRLTQVQK